MAASLPSLLKDILRGEALQTPDDSGMILLREKQAGMLVEVFGLPPSTVSIDIDKFSHFEFIDNVSMKRKKKCDYILVDDSDDKMVVALVEMKKQCTPLNKVEATLQLRRSLPFFEYFRSMCEAEHGDEFCRDDISMTYFFLAEVQGLRFAKQPLRVGRPNGSKGSRGRMFEDGQVQVSVGPSISYSRLFRL